VHHKARHVSGFLLLQLHKDPQVFQSNSVIAYSCGLVVCWHVQVLVDARRVPLSVAAAAIHMISHLSDDKKLLEGNY
jgi:hypothetical protein